MAKLFSADATAGLSGPKCFRLMAAEITFDSAYRIQRQEVQGGRFLTQAEFEASPPV